MNNLPSPSMVWCHSHQTLERTDDLIDFPCSNSYLDAYYQQGLTPRKSPTYYRVDEEVNLLPQGIGFLFGEVNRLSRARAVPPKVS